jgi:hypothetical protein
MAMFKCVNSNLGPSIGAVNSNMAGVGNTSGSTSTSATMTKDGYAVITGCGYSQYNGCNFSMSVKVNNTTPTNLVQRYDRSDGIVWGRMRGFTCEVKKGDVVSATVSVSGGNVSYGVSIINIGK